MKLINSRKLSWIIFGIGCLVAVISIFFLPNIIPMHFSGGVADGFSDKIQIFIFPILQLILMLLSGREKVKYFLTHTKTFLTDVQYNWMIDGVLFIILITEIYVIYASFI
ncbi:MAG: DUF1648 domain-containing protein [Eubacteriales bacterium]|nr:DUF1648 domain-containing protein [Eubacteriales bacterium]